MKSLLKLITIILNHNQRILEDSARIVLISNLSKKGREEGRKEGRKE